MNGQIRGCPIQKTHVIVQPRNFDPIQKTHVKGGAAQLWGAPELIYMCGGTIFRLPLTRGHAVFFAHNGVVWST